MSKVRRFRVESLENVRIGDALILPAEEMKHAHVLRLGADTEIELFDDKGRSANAVLASTAGELAARIIFVAAPSQSGQQLILAVAWPKGKRASILVEKCCELGVDRLIPIRYARSIVSKDDDAEGVARLRRSAVEAAKQCGRNEPLVIAPEQTFKAALEHEATVAFSVIADPRSEQRLADLLIAERAEIATRAVLVFVGPEGGFTEGELDAARRHGLRQARLARNVLRVETASVAACAITRAILDSLCRYDRAKA